MYFFRQAIMERRRKTSLRRRRNAYCGRERRRRPWGAEERKGLVFIFGN